VLWSHQGFAESSWIQGDREHTFVSIPDGLGDVVPFLVFELKVLEGYLLDYVGMTVMPDFSLKHCD
jgi:hypothetical protein